MPKKQITLESVQEGLKRYKAENNHEPSSHEIDDCPYLPQARSIQRSLGGLKKVREGIGFNTDQTKGKTRSKISRKINLRANKQEARIFKYLEDLFKFPNVARNYPFNLESKASIDFAIHLKNKTVMVDVFEPNGIRTAQSCVNHKLNKHKEHPTDVYVEEREVEMIFVCLNKDITQEMLDEKIRRTGGYSIITEETFKDLMIQYSQC